MPALKVYKHGLFAKLLQIGEMIDVADAHHSRRSFWGQKR